MAFPACVDFQTPFSFAAQLNTYPARRDVISKPFLEHFRLTWISERKGRPSCINLALPSIESINPFLFPSRLPIKLVNCLLINPSHGLNLRLNELLQLSVLAQFPDQLLDLLSLALVCQQYRVVRLHQDGITQTDYRNRRFIFCPRVVDDVSRAVHVDEIRHHTIAFRIGLEMPAQRRPRPDVIPFERAVGHNDV